MGDENKYEKKEIFSDPLKETYGANVENSFRNIYLYPLTASVFLFFFCTLPFIRWYKSILAPIEDTDLQSDLFMSGVIIFLLLCVAVPAVLTKIIMNIFKKRNEKL